MPHSGHSILRDIQVSVLRTEPHAKHSNHPAYVFAVQPRIPQTPLQRSRLRLLSQSSLSSMASLLSPSMERTTSFREESDRDRVRCFSTCSTLSSSSPPVVHEVARTYSQCRRLYLDLMAYTNCTSPDSCACLNGSCPFWTMYLLLQAFPFPRKTLLNFQSRVTCRRRMQALNGLMITIFEKLQTYKEEYFAHRETHGCRVLAALEDFLDLSDDFACRFRAMDSRLQLKLNLNGWRSDRPHLYFRDEEDAEAQALTQTSLQKPNVLTANELEDLGAVPSPSPAPVRSPKPLFDDMLSPLSSSSVGSPKNDFELEPLLSPWCPSPSPLYA